MSGVVVLSQDELAALLERSARKGALMALREVDSLTRRSELTEAEAAQVLGQSPNTLRQWRCQGRGPAWTKAGRRVLYRRADLDDWLAGQRRETGQTLDVQAIADQIVGKEARYGKAL